MRYLLLFLLFPLSAPCQTVHIVDDNIVYSGKVNLKDIDRHEISMRAKKALATYIKHNDLHYDGDSSITTPGIIILSTPYPVIKKLRYQYTLVTVGNGYRYNIDNVSIAEKERGQKWVITPSKDIFKNIEVSGPTAMETERLLNEIDLQFQALLDRIKNDISNVYPLKKRSQ
ncbi:MAG: hypothetical protein ABJA37_14330 [Ferruginibacter sp.]